jgi:hypothetical protein
VTTPIDLRELATTAGYRTSLDPTAEIDTTQAERAWQTRVPAKYGFITPWSATDLAGYCNASRLFSQLLAVPTARPVQRGDSELRIVFAPEHLEIVASILKAQRRRRMSDATRRKLSPTWFKATSPTTA